jgi:flagellar basal-body rod modification protein FlgD
MSTGISQIANVSAKNSVSSLVGAASGTPASNDKSRKTIAQNFDSFLGLLTTQLKNQNPLEPLDANAFTQQLVQFSGVEQQLKTNDLLASLATNGALGGANGASTRLNAASAASLIGVKVSANAATTRLSTNAAGESNATFPVTVQANYGNYQVSITNDKGEEVYKTPWAPTATGEQSFAWNGVRNNGIAVPKDGTYTISVVGETAGGLKSRMSTDRSGIVTAVDLSGSEEMVQFGGYSLPLSQIKKVSVAGI